MHQFSPTPFNPKDLLVSLVESYFEPAERYIQYLELNGYITSEQIVLNTTYATTKNQELDLAARLFHLQISSELFDEFINVITNFLCCFLIVVVRHSFLNNHFFQIGHIFLESPTVDIFLQV